MGAYDHDDSRLDEPPDEDAESSARDRAEGLFSNWNEHDRGTAYIVISTLFRRHDLLVDMAIEAGGLEGAWISKSDLLNGEVKPVLRRTS